MLQCDAGWKIGINVPADQDSPNDHASCPFGSVRTSAGDGGNLRNSTPAKEGAAVKPAGTGRYVKRAYEE